MLKLELLFGPSKKMLFRYITKQLLFITLISTTILCMIFWLAKASTMLDFIINRGLNFSLFLYMSMLILPRLLLILLPIATIATILFAYYRLQTDSELVVMRTAGMNTYSLAKPGLVVGGCLLYTSPSPRDATLSRMPSSA